MAVGPRAFNLLVALAERAGKLVSKDELLDLVWPNLVVEENNLQVQVSALRKILGADAIATVPGHGYRFTLDLTREVVEPALLAPSTKHNLPQQVTSFVGRVRVLTEVKEALGKTRLLTLVGFGGFGKSRLSLQVAASLKNDYPDGVWFVEMAPLTDARLVPQAVASVLGVREEAGHPVVEALLKQVKDRQLLLIVDSCEHLVHACAELASQLLQAGPHLKILATSRERLNVAGETMYPVLALAMPEPHQAITLEAFTQYEAVRLFIDRAAAAQPAFQLTQQTAMAVADICHRVEGIPLAIELAAARMRTMSVENLAERLNDRFRLLTRGDPTAAPRLQTLRALIDWSYDHLTDHERALFRRLAVFVGGWTLDAAEAIGASDDVDAVEVLDLLSELIEKSLVTMEAEGRRYRLLDTVREYAQERLDESGEGDGTRAQHLAFYLAFAEKARPQFLGPEQGTWFTRFDLERDNFLAAHAWCGHTEDGAALGLRLVYAMSLYWIHRGGLELGYRVTLEALARAPAQVRSLARCRGVYIAAQIASCMGDYMESQKYGEESLSIAREIGDGERITIALMSLALQFVSQGRRPEARRNIEEALTIARRLEQKILLGSVLGQLAELNRADGDLDTAEPLYEEALALAREFGELRGVIVQLLNLASVSIARGSGERPRGMLLEALAIVEQIGSKVLGASVLQIAAGLAAFIGEWRRAAQLHGAATALCEQIGYHVDPTDEAFVVPLISEAREALGEPAFAAAEATGRALSYDTALAEVRAWLQERAHSSRAP
jgi:non-specific serine/threonine protein kinase